MLKKLITYETALAASTTPDDFALQFRGVAKSSDQVVPTDPAPKKVSANPGDANLELDRNPMALFRVSLR